MKSKNHFIKFKNGDKINLVGDSQEELKSLTSLPFRRSCRNCGKVNQANEHFTYIGDPATEYHAIPCYVWKCDCGLITIEDKKLYE